MTTVPDWVRANVAVHGFPAGRHAGHVTSYEPNVAVVEVTGARIAYCHWCEDLAPESEITPL